MEKEVITQFRKKYYLLGIRKEDHAKVWLKAATWDCSWYRGLGYIEVFNKNCTDVKEHTHFDTLFLKDIPESMREYFEETTFNNTEMWQLLDLMKSAYICREYSDLLKNGANICSKAVARPIVNNDTEYERLNKDVIPKLLKEVYKILSK